MSLTINGYVIPHGLTCLMGIDPSTLYELGQLRLQGLLIDETGMDGGASSQEDLLEPLDNGDFGDEFDPL